MSEMPLALLVTEGGSWVSGLKTMLEHRGFAVYAAPNCAEAALLLHGYTPPHLVFTDMQLADGSWAGILSLAEISSLPVNVIVVARHADIQTYVRVLERGAFDFVVTPFEDNDIHYVIRNAMASAEFRRQAARAKRRPEASPPANCGQNDDEIPLRNEGFHIASLSS